MNIYFSGLGGVGIGPLVEIALDAGYQVQGSDLVDSLETQELAQRGVPMSIGSQDGVFLRECHQVSPIDWFVYTAALPDDHPELLLAQELGIKVTKRDGLTAQIIQDKNLKLIAVSGTHGKTTTTGMLLWVLQQLDIPVSYSIGTTLSFGPSGKFDPASDYFVYECDEFDRNFLHFHPYLALLPSVDYDHPDTYPTAADYAEAFRQFIDQSGHSIIWQRDSEEINNSNPHSWILNEDDVATVKLAGAHNRRNATLILKAIEYLDLDIPAAQAALETFPGTNRRFEKLANNLYSDYGHHPTEIAATLQMARELSDHVVLIYQPHQNRRQHELLGKYIDQFKDAETTYWLPTYLSREDPNLAILSPEELYKMVTNHESIKAAQLDDELWTAIESARDAGKLVLAMGAGTIDGWLRKQLSA